MSDVTRYSCFTDGEMWATTNGDWIKKSDYDDLMKAFDEERESNKNTGIAECHDRASETKLLKQQLRESLRFLGMYYNTPFPLEIRVCYGEQISELLKVEV